MTPTKRKVVVRLSDPQLTRMRPAIDRRASDALVVPAHLVEGVVLEVLGRDSRARAPVSDYALTAVVECEIAEYLNAPSAYEDRIHNTAYEVVATRQMLPRDSGGSRATGRGCWLRRSPSRPIPATPTRGWRSLTRSTGTASHGGSAPTWGRWPTPCAASSGATGAWRGSYLDLRLALFYEARELHHMGSGSPFDPLDDADYRAEIAGLLGAIRDASRAKGAGTVPHGSASRRPNAVVEATRSTEPADAQERRGP